MKSKIKISVIYCLTVKKLFMSKMFLGFIHVNRKNKNGMSYTAWLLKNCLWARYSWDLFMLTEKRKNGMLGLWRFLVWCTMSVDFTDRVLFHEKNICHCDFILDQSICWTYDDNRSLIGRVVVLVIRDNKATFTQLEQLQ